MSVECVLVWCIAILRQFIEEMALLSNARIDSEGVHVYIHVSALTLVPSAITATLHGKSNQENATLDAQQLRVKSFAWVSVLYLHYSNITHINAAVEFG